MSESHQQKLREIIDARMRTTGHIFFRTGARRFLEYLKSDWPRVTQFSELRRDPHLLGFLQWLSQRQPPVAVVTQRTYVAALRCVFHDLASNGYSLDPRLILPEDLPRVPRSPQQLRKTIFPRPQRPHVLHQLFETQIQDLATTLRPKTIHHYRVAARHFLFYLQTEFPDLTDLSALRRNPHLLGYFRYLCQIHPHAPLSNHTRRSYLVDLRRLFECLASANHLVAADLIVTQDIPIPPELLPKALSPDDDRRLHDELRRIDNLSANALLLTRATGIRISECIDLAADCLRPVGPDRWALHVPLGKLHTERLVPADSTVRTIVDRITELRGTAPPSHLAAGWLLPRPKDAKALYSVLSHDLAEAAIRAGCSHRVTCHQLRHTFATEMLNLHVSLPALMRLLGHKHINMTLRYLRVTQDDVWREFHIAMQNQSQRHIVPQLAVPESSSTNSFGFPAIWQAVQATRHLLEMYRRQLQDAKARRKLYLLGKRLSTVARELNRFKTAGE